jgi:hypothetical protein
LITAFPKLEQCFLPSLSWGCIVFIEQVDKLADAGRPQSTGGKLLMCFYNLCVVVLCKALRLKRQNVGDGIFTVYAECKTVVSGRPGRRSATRSGS